MEWNRIVPTHIEMRVEMTNEDLKKAVLAYIRNEGGEYKIPDLGGMYDISFLPDHHGNLGASVIWLEDLDNGVLDSPGGSVSGSSSARLHRQ